MGAVYRAHDTALGRDVAVKVLRPELVAEPGFQERFRREAYAAGRLASPNIIPIYETGEIDGRLYLVMPIVDGVDVNRALDRDGPMSPEKAVRVVEQVAAALDSAHKSGLVHRDVKSSNLLMVGEDFVYLIDFGLVHEANAARLTLTNVAPGSPAYMAPERFKAGTTIDARADVYSLACVLYECLTARLPFSGGGVEGLTVSHLKDEPPKPSSFDPAIPAGFDEVIARGMAKEPADRYQSAHELAVAARAALTDDVVLPPPPPRRQAAAPSNPSPPPNRRRTRALTIAALVLVVVLAVAESCGSPTNSRSMPRKRSLSSCCRLPVWTGPRAWQSMRRATSTSSTAATTGCWSWPRARTARPWHRLPPGPARRDSGRRRGRLRGHRPRKQPGAGAGGGVDQPDRAALYRPRRTHGCGGQFARSPQRPRRLCHRLRTQPGARAARAFERSDRAALQRPGGPSAVAVGSDRVLFVLDRENERVLKLPGRRTSRPSCPTRSGGRIFWPSTARETCT